MSAGEKQAGQKIHPATASQGGSLFTIYNLILHHPVNIQEKYNGAAYLYAFGNIYHSHSIIFANLTFFHSFCTALADIIQDLLFPLFSMHTINVIFSYSDTVPLY